jgi:hypothetical protein
VETREAQGFSPPGTKSDDRVPPVPRENVAPVIAVIAFIVIVVIVVEFVVAIIIIIINVVIIIGIAV